MHFLYIKNYLDNTNKEQKKDFFNFLIEKSFVPSNQKIILNDKSLILEFDKSLEVNSLQETINTYFENFEKIEVFRILKILKNEKKLILVFSDKKKKEIKL
ncbi:hypothetical protein CP960_07060 [Malaciobacter halophilus]|uniref:Uncharacterized protein n=1 Tax=Malaciobacter halophilus TaxID=197482 RepID=A0A2N1J2G7_9BACT|nr:hypothetical protein [Malaciobacter halophilus]AXH09923.1 hypothetical protein AHALO_1555 [Malaciobacter halophilus]PKI80756.1 hypothetical protein CP960_07060 [Malaciobacter halophilus]